MPISAVREIFEVEEIIPVRQINVSEPNLYGVDLSFNGYDSQYSLHALHPYVAAINPPLVKSLIDTYVPKNGNILDPFCGGGGVLLEATLQRRQSAGGDVNPLSVILSKAKTTYIEQSKILKAFIQIIELAETVIPNEKIKIDKQLEFWFKKESIPVIHSLINAINTVTANDNKLNNLYNAIFSATVRDVMLTYRGEVRLRKLREEDSQKFNPDVLRSFAKRYKIAYDRIITLPNGSVSDIAVRDIKKMEFKDESFHTLICSPPYADDKNGVGYFQFSKNMLEWLGYTKEEISNHKKLFLGANKEINALPKSESLELSLENVQQRNLTHFKEAVSFYYDYNLGLQEMARVIQKNIIIVIGNRVLSRTQFDNAQITVDFFKNMGVKLKHHYTRELRKKRIANMGGDGGGIAKEHILVFQK
ncbi:MAG: DNA methyltransferase [Bacteroidales bacterium]|nr:DNA methyltransferase [Bacteroidales bacterium]